MKIINLTHKKDCSMLIYNYVTYSIEHRTKIRSWEWVSDHMTAVVDLQVYLKVYKIIQ